MITNVICFDENTSKLLVMLWSWSYNFSIHKFKNEEFYEQKPEIQSKNEQIKFR